MALCADDFSESFIQSAQSLLITGTHLSTEKTLTACNQAIQYALSGNTKVILGIDYRPMLWGFTPLGDGETRFISNHTVSSHLQKILPQCNLIISAMSLLVITSRQKESPLASFLALTQPMEATRRLGT